MLQSQQLLKDVGSTHAVIGGMQSKRLGRSTLFWAAHYGVLGGLLLLCVFMPRHDSSVTQGEYPQRPVQLVVPFAPGGGTDRFAREIQRAIQEENLLPQPLVIVNVDGAGATIGSRQVKDAKPDGYNLLLLNESIVTSRYNGNVEYGPEAFEAIAGTGEIGLVIATGDQYDQYQTLEDLMTAAEQSPDELVFAANLGTPSHFAGRLLEQQAPGARFRFTQTGGGAKRYSAIKGGHAVASAFSIEEYSRWKKGGLRALAVCQAVRHPAEPGLPTTFEQGYGFRSVNMQFWWAPKGTPQKRLDVLAQALQKAMKTPRVQDMMRDIQSKPTFLTGAALQEEIAGRQEAIASVTRRETIELPDFAFWTCMALGVTVAGMIATAARNWLTAAPPATTATDADATSKAAVEPAQQAPAFSVRDNLLPAVAGCGLLIIYVYALGAHMADFRPLTSLFIAATGGNLVAGRWKLLPAVDIVAVTLGFGIYYVFGSIFQIVLP